MRYALFVDLKAAFDKVDRQKQWEVMEKKDLNKGLIERIRKIYEKTKATVRTKEDYAEEFTVKKGLRQGCVLSPSLFNIYIYI